MCVCIIHGKWERLLPSLNLDNLGSDPTSCHQCKSFIFIKFFQLSHKKIFNRSLELFYLPKLQLHSEDKIYAKTCFQSMLSWWRNCHFIFYETVLSKSNNNRKKQHKLLYIVICVCTHHCFNKQCESLMCSSPTCSDYSALFLTYS